MVGYNNLGVWEWVGMAGGPVLIYVMRTLTHAYFTMRIETIEARLKDQQTERATTIQKLKDATKYDSTHELLEKYGGEKPKRATQNHGEDEREKNTKDGNNGRGRHSSLGPNGPPSRTTFAPPPTANIQRPPSAQGAPTSIRHPNLIPLPPSRPSSSHNPPPRHQLQPLDFTAEFAPNADDLPHTPYPQYDHNPNNTHRWYDRILDLMLGEDETAPKNRIVLICQNCRLVNGQAPPGTKALPDVGLWKCMSCGSMNGEMDEGKKIMREVLGGETIRPSIEVTADHSDGGSADEVGAQIMSEDAMATGREPTGPQTRSRRSGRTKA